MISVVSGEIRTLQGDPNRIPLTSICFTIDCVKNLKTEFEDTQIPIDDDNVTFHRLCEKLEYLIYAGIRGLLQQFMF